MKCNATILTAFAVGIVSVRANPVQMLARAASAPTDRFVSCMQQTYPGFPKEGTPTSKDIQTCFEQDRPMTKREVAAEPRVKIVNDSDKDTQLAARGFVDSVTILGKTLGIGAEPVCKDKDDKDIILHEEFVWSDDIIPLADAICDDVNRYLEHSGLDDYSGGAGFASREFGNGHDLKNDRSGILLNHRKLLLTVATTVFPPAQMADVSIKMVADGVHKVCSAGIQKILNGPNGCSRNVRWYVSQKAKHKNKLAAIGGVVDVFLGSANSRVGSIRIGFTEDSG